MNGTLIPNTPIAVDFWQTRRCSHVRLFFLSHMHSDHTMGLSSTWKHPLYCSPVTAKILKHQLQVSNKWINPLEVGQCHMLPMDDTGIETVAVTLIDANHCPGSVMFLFEGYFGTILYTGDFRYTPRMLNDLPLRNKKIIDVLYLDNTNCDPGHKLPSRQEATNQIKEIIDRHPEHDIVIGLYSIGKESLLVDLAKTFKSWIVVRPLRLELLRILEMENVFVAEEGAGRFRIVEQSEVNYANMMQWNRVYPTLAILPTSRRAKVWHKDIHVVPYSDHSSFDELIEFVAGLEPCSIIPVVKTQVCEVHFQQYLSSRKKPQTCVKIPASVRAYMKRQESTGKTGTERLFKATFPKHVPRGVEFESPEKRPDSTIGFGSLKDNQKSSPNSLDIESINLPKHDMGDSFLNVKRRSRAHMPLTESTVLMSTKSPCPHMTDESDDDVLEMPSRIFWSPKDDNMTAISETSPLSPEATSIVSHDIPDKKVSLFFKCTNMEWKGEDSEKCSVSAGLSIVPWKKQGNSGPQNFHSQVERYFKELHSADGQN